MNELRGLWAEMLSAVHAPYGCLLNVSLYLLIPPLASVHNPNMRMWISIPIVLGMAIAEASAQGINPNLSGPVVSVTQKVTPLSWSSTDSESEAAFNCSASPGAIPVGSTVTYSWSGLDFRGQASQQTATGYATSAGTYTVSCHIHVVYPNPPGGTADYNPSTTCYAFGGPITGQSDRPRGGREGRTGQSGTQPWMLEDYSGGSQEQSTIQFSAVSNQPGTGTTFQWSESGTLAFTGSTIGGVATVTANGNGGRGGSSVTVTYTVTIDGQHYSAADSTDPQYKAISCHRPLYCKYYDSDTDVNNSPGVTDETFYLYIVSNIGDPLDGTDFQERYPGPNCIWLGNTLVGPAPDYGMPSVAQVGFQVQWDKITGGHFHAGEATNKPVNPGYTYNSKSGDRNYMVYIGDPGTGLTLYQVIEAATVDTDPSASGILQSCCGASEFTINVAATVTRTPDGL